MPEFRAQDLSGSVFDEVDLTGAVFRNVALEDATFRGVWGTRLDLDGDFDEIVYNGVDLMPLWRAEMVRRHPEFALLPPHDADAFRELWPRLEALWSATVERARALPPGLLHERVDGEWSFTETLRHLLFVHDAWLRRAVLHEPAPYDELDLAHDDMHALDGVPAADPAARPSLDHVLALREERLAIARGLFETLTDDALSGSTSVTGPGYPVADTYAVRRCLRAVVNEEWWHHRFAVRDLTVLEAG
ncbi:DinB family protein [Nocardioides halotolerans]|uniref:DinB family protein n=1 Tax=Nocardioides halotolerans TaxID=433660 RepID=UPI000409CBB9|nr:DinB family protein [Nocardioides halotolerans]